MSIKPEELKPCPFCGKEPDMSDGDSLYPTGTGWKDEAVAGLAALAGALS